VNGASVNGDSVNGDSVNGGWANGGWANWARGNFHPRPGPSRSPHGSPGCRNPAKRQAAHGPAAADRHGALGAGG